VDAVSEIQELAPLPPSLNHCISLGPQAAGDQFALAKENFTDGQDFVCYVEKQIFRRSDSPVGLDPAVRDSLLRLQYTILPLK
jgi:hypothetical protein